MLRSVCFVRPAGVGQLEDDGDDGGCSLGKDEGFDAVASEDGEGGLEDEAVGFHHRGATVVDDGEVVQSDGLLGQPLH